MPVALVMLSLVPVIAGGARITELAVGTEVTPGNARFFASPVPVVLHIVTATGYCLLGAFQFLPRLRRSGWHRRAGRILVPAGLLAAASGLWMTLFYPHQPGGGDLATVLRLIFGTFMIIAIVLGFLAIRRRNIVAHRAWMIRGYAIGLGAGTQVFTGALSMLLVDATDEQRLTFVLGVGWVINLVVAELIIRRRRT